MVAKAAVKVLDGDSVLQAQLVGRTCLGQASRKVGAERKRLGNLGLLDLGYVNSLYNCWQNYCSSPKQLKRPR